MELVERSQVKKTHFTHTHTHGQLTQGIGFLTPDRTSHDLELLIQKGMNHVQNRLCAKQVYFSLHSICPGPAMTGPLRKAPDAKISA